MRPIDRRTALKTLGGSLAGASLLPTAAVWGDDRPTAVILGSGIAGLSAAYDLQRAGFAVTVMEKEGMAGGRMVDAWIGPRYMNPHAGGVLSAYRQMWTLAEEVGVSLSGDFPYDESVIDNGHGAYNHALRFLFTEIMNIPGLSDETKKRLPKLFPDLARIREEVDPCYIITGLDYDNESMAEYYERLLGKSSAKEIIDYWVDPVFEAWGSTPETGNCIVLLSWFAQQEADFNIPREGIGVLTRRLAELVPIQYDTTVMRVTDADASGRHTVHYLSPDGQRGSVTPDVVVCATQGKYVPQIVERLTDKQRTLFDQVFFTQYASTIFLLKEEYAPAEFTYGHYIPRHPDPDKRRLNYWGAAPIDIADREKRPSLEVVPARREIANWTASGKALPSYCLELVRPLYPIEDRMIDDVVVNAGDDLVDVPPGFATKMAAVIHEQEQERHGLYFTGEYLGAPHTGGACASGRLVARTISKHWA